MSSRRLNIFKTQFEQPSYIRLLRVKMQFRRYRHICPIQTDRSDGCSCASTLSQCLSPFNVIVEWTANRDGRIHNLCRGTRRPLLLFDCNSVQIENALLYVSSVYTLTHAHAHPHGGRASK